MEKKTDPRKWAKKRRDRFAALVMRLRGSLELTVGEAAVQACVAPNTWSRWENARCVPHRATSRAALVRLASRAGVPPKVEAQLREVLRGE